MLMITLLIMVQCVYPIVEANAVAAAAGAVFASAIAVLLIMFGIKILPTKTISLQEIYSRLITTIKKGGESIYPTLTSLFNTIVTEGIRIGATIKLYKMQLTNLKNELVNALNITTAGMEFGSYTGENVLINDVVISDSKNILVENEVEFDYDIGQYIEITSLENQSILYGGTSYLKAEYYQGSYLHYLEWQTCKYIKITLVDARIYLTFYYNTGSRTAQSIPMRAGVNRIVFEGSGAKTDHEGNPMIYLAQYNGDTLLGKQVVRIIAPPSNYLYLYFPKGNNYYTITTTKYVDISANTKAKVIPGVYDELIRMVDTYEDKSIDVTLPNTLTPRLQDVCADLKTRLDTLNPSIDYDDILTHTWDETISEEIPDIVDGTIPGIEAGELEHIEDMPDREDLELPAIITNKFPFSIPWDVKRAINCLISPPEVPKFVLPFRIDSIGINEQIEIDLSDFEVVAVICRWFTTLSVCFGLILATRKLIGQ